MLPFGGSPRLGGRQTQACLSHVLRAQTCEPGQGKQRPRVPCSQRVSQKARLGTLPPPTRAANRCPGGPRKPHGRGPFPELRREVLWHSACLAAMGPALRALSGPMCAEAGSLRNPQAATALGGHPASLQGHQHGSRDTLLAQAQPGPRPSRHLSNAWGLHSSSVPPLPPACPPALSWRLSDLRPPGPTGTPRLFTSGTGTACVLSPQPWGSGAQTRDHCPHPQSRRQVVDAMGG